MKTRLFKKLRRNAQREVYIVNTFSGRYEVRVCGRPVRSCSTLAEAKMECDFFRRLHIRLALNREKVKRNKELTVIY